MSGDLAFWRFVTIQAREMLAELINIIWILDNTEGDQILIHPWCDNTCVVGCSIKGYSILRLVNYVVRIPGSRLARALSNMDHAAISDLRLAVFHLLGTTPSLGSHGIEISSPLGGPCHTPLTTDWTGCSATCGIACAREVHGSKGTSSARTLPPRLEYEIENSVVWS